MSIYDSKTNISEKGISIIVTYYENGRYFNDFLASYRELRIVCEHELIVVDDGSSDTSYMDRVELPENTKMLRQQKNIGSQRARNIGLHAAKYEFILMMDGDDKFSDESSTYINYAVESMEENDKIVFFHGLTYMFDGFSGYTISSYPLNPKMVSEMHHVPTSIIYRKCEAMDSGGYAENISKWQDWAFGVALINNRINKRMEYEIGFIEKKAILYRVIDNKNRLSQKEFNLINEISKVICLYPAFFEVFYPANSNICMLVYKNKPSRLIELITVALYNKELAEQIIFERGYDVNHDCDKEWIP